MVGLRDAVSGSSEASGVEMAEAVSDSDSATGAVEVTGDTVALSVGGGTMLGTRLSVVMTGALARMVCSIEGSIVFKMSSTFIEKSIRGDGADTAFTVVRMWWLSTPCVGRRGDEFGTRKY